MVEQLLTEEHRKAIDDALASLKLVKQELIRASQAGIDVAAQSEQAKELEAKLLQLKRAYFPARTSK
jgi:hypothetical protein